jgi:hypothetical protein
MFIIKVRVELILYGVPGKLGHNELDLLLKIEQELVGLFLGIWLKIALSCLVLLLPVLAAVAESLRAIEAAIWMDASHPYSLLRVVVRADASVSGVLRTKLCSAVHFALKAVKF